MVAHSSEFENIVVREEEQNELETLARSCPLEIKGGPSSKHGKVSILIQVSGYNFLIKSVITPNKIYIFLIIILVSCHTDVHIQGVV